MTVRVADTAVLVPLRSGGALVGLRQPAAAYLTPTAWGWLHGDPPEPADRYQECVAGWQAVGLVEATGDSRASSPVPDPWSALLADARALPTGRALMVVATSGGCGFCRQLEADIVANHQSDWPVGATVVLVEDGKHTTWGADLESSTLRTVTGWGPPLAQAGTPSAVVVDSHGDARIMTGYSQISEALVRMSGLSPEQVVAEPPSTCSINVATSAPIDALRRLRGGDGRCVGVAVRGEDAYQVADEAVGSASEPAVYVPVTLTLERPRGLYLLFRGGEMAARARTAAEARQVLRQVLDGFAAAGPEEVSLLAGALAHRGGTCLLFPRAWMSHLVKRASRLARAGWSICPDPFVHLSPTPAGPTILAQRHRPRRVGNATVDGILIQRPESASNGIPPHVRLRLHAQAVNWIARPCTPKQLREWTGVVGRLPLHVGTEADAVAFLTDSRWS